MSQPANNLYTIDRKRWSQLPVLEQLGNIGSEVGRTLNMKRRNENFEQALIRALDLFDATVEGLVAKKSYRAKEILRAKEQFLMAVYDHEDPTIENYFMQFAIAARNRRTKGQ